MNSDLAIFLVLMIPATAFLGAYDVLGKRLMLKSELPVPLVVGVSFMLSGLMLSPFLLWTGIPAIGSGFVSAVCAIVLINAASNFAWYQALKREEASLLAPTRLLTPPLVLVTAYFFLGEVPAVAGAIGVLTTILGLYLLIASEAKTAGIDFLKVLKRPGVLIAFLCAISGAITFSLDKKAVTASSAMFFTVVFFVGVGGCNLIAALFSGAATVENLYALRRNSGRIAVFSFVHAAGALLSFAALSFTLAAYAASTKRLWSLFSVLFAGQILKEKNIRAKLVAVLVMLIGIAIPLIWG
ncbi:MAG: EamA family transporter [Candidatus Melainabacteria bacterium]|nr:EamA family transporter [Candidatus Melainabacteria bacterium]